MKASFKPHPRREIFPNTIPTLPFKISLSILLFFFHCRMFKSSGKDGHAYALGPDSLLVSILPLLSTLCLCPLPQSNIIHPQEIRPRDNSIIQHSVIYSDFPFCHNNTHSSWVFAFVFILDSGSRQDLVLRLVAGFPSSSFMWTHDPTL